jgi:hypothetical protein
LKPAGASQLGQTFDNQGGSVGFYRKGIGSFAANSSLVSNNPPSFSRNAFQTIRASHLGRFTPFMPMQVATAGESALSSLTGEGLQRPVQSYGLAAPMTNFTGLNNKGLATNYQPEPVQNLRQSTVKQLADISRNGSNIWKTLGQTSTTKEN